MDRIQIQAQVSPPHPPPPTCLVPPPSPNPSLSSKQAPAYLAVLSAPLNLPTVFLVDLLLPLSLSNPRATRCSEALLRPRILSPSSRRVTLARVCLALPPRRLPQHSNSPNNNRLGRVCLEMLPRQRNPKHNLPRLAAVYSTSPSQRSLPSSSNRASCKSFHAQPP